MPRKPKPSTPPAPKAPVLAIPWQGHPGRFTGKWKDPATGKWARIPGGAFPVQVDTHERALVFAAKRYEIEVERLRPEAAPAVATWDQCCDAYIADVKDRVGLAGSTWYEAEQITKSHLRGSSLASLPVADVDEHACIQWLRGVARANIARVGEPVKTRSGNTLKNISKHLPGVFRVAILKKLVPGLTVNPAKGEEYKAELIRILKGRTADIVSLPAESFAALVSCDAIAIERRVAYLVMGLTGARPGEAHGLRFSDWQTIEGVEVFTIEQQIALKRSSVLPVRVAPPKTEAGRRTIPLHEALLGPLRAWRDGGWQRYVGRAPKPGDVILPDASGRAFRVKRSGQFQADLATAGVPTTYKGHALKPYSLRHYFSSAFEEGGGDSAVGDYVMGHAAKGTRARHYTERRMAHLHSQVNKLVFRLASPTSEGAPSEPPPGSVEGNTFGREFGRGDPGGDDVNDESNLGSEHLEALDPWWDPRSSKPVWATQVARAGSIPVRFRCRLESG